MIYASLKSVQAWHTPLTPLCYLLFAAAGGFSLAAFFAAAGGGPVTLPARWPLVFLVAAWTAKLFWRNRMNTLRPMSTPETATGLGFIGKVRLFERPHVNDNYLTSEMGFRGRAKACGEACRDFARIWRRRAGAGVSCRWWRPARSPGSSAALIALLAVASHAAGMLVERWLFFAEARHAVMNYYGG